MGRISFNILEQIQVYLVLSSKSELKGTKASLFRNMAVKNILRRRDNCRVNENILYPFVVDHGAQVSLSFLAGPLNSVGMLVGN